MGGPEVKALMNRPINSRGHCLRGVSRLVQGSTKMEMHPPLGPRDTGNDVLEVLPRRLRRPGIGCEAPGLRHIARVELVGDGHGHDGQIAHHFGEGTRALTLADEKHFDDRRIGAVLPVLRSPFTLRNPHGRPLFQGVMDVGGGQGEGRELLPEARHGATNNEAFIQAHEVGRGLRGQEVIADRDPGRGEARLMERVIQQNGVEGNIPVIRNEQVSPVGVEGLQPGPAEAVRAASKHMGHDPFEARLEVIDGLKVTGALGQHPA